MAKIRQCAKWMASLQARNLRLEMLPGRVGPGAGAGLRYNLRQAKEHGRKLQALEARRKGFSHGAREVCFPSGLHPPYTYAYFTAGTVRRSFTYGR